MAPSSPESMVQGLSLDVKPLAEALKTAEAQGMAHMAASIARVLPHLAHSSPTAQAALLDHFVLSLDLAALDAAPSGSTREQQVAPPHCGQHDQSCLRCMLHV